MKYQAIMFDLDGTLLPMELENFTKNYFALLAKRLKKYPLDSQTLVRAIWSGTEAMVRNDGTSRNSEVFWNVFKTVAGYCSEELMAECDDFYSNEFMDAKRFTGENPYAADAVRLAREKADTVILATNPLFPLAGQRSRLSWIGLKPEDFDLVTHYESDCFCKPNPEYFLAICSRLKLQPERCLHIGNDDREDMWAAQKAGLKSYLVTDCRIQDPEHPWEGPQGNFRDMLNMLESL